jgi:poly-gamma-glutamate synthesis protein (capsule biosynthesis protein)
VSVNGCYISDETAGVINSFNFNTLDEDCQSIKGDIDAAKAAGAQVIVVYYHWGEEYQREPNNWQKKLAQRTADMGADVIFASHPHVPQMMEFVTVTDSAKQVPVFYSLGNFIFQTETVSVQPADAFLNKGMPHDTMIGEYMNQRSNNGTRGFCTLENIWRSVMAGFTAEDGRITQIQLYPITLCMGAPRSKMGIPHLAEDDGVLRYLAKLSEPFGTKLRIENNVAIIDL